MLHLDRTIVMIGLGSLGHPALKDGVHLRWQARRELGFPWYGYYLLRRLHRPGRFLCLSRYLESRPTGVHSGTTLSLPPATISSDLPLVLTDNFPSSGTPEVQLGPGSFIQVDCAEEARRIRIVLGFRAEGEVRVEVRAGTVTLETVRLKGKKGNLVTREFAHDFMTAVRLGAGPAALVDFCCVPVSQDAAYGWEFLADFPYPMGLPVTHPNYPCTGLLPENPSASEATAVSRIRYPLPTGTYYAKLYDQMIELVKSGPGGPPMAEISQTHTGVPDSGDTDPAPTMPALYPLDLVLLGALHPGIAQMVGLYWVDQTAAPDQSYDYMIIGALSQIRLSKENTGKLLESAELSIPGYICFDLRPQPPADLDAPTWVDGYALAGLTVKRSDGTWVNAINNAGLCWDRKAGQNGLLRPDCPVLYWIHRVGCGSGAAPSSPSEGDYAAISDTPAVITTNDDVGADTTWPPGWPQFRLHAVDRALAEGWYSYRVMGQDLFGRRSALSPASRWKDADGTTVRHPFAVRLVDDTPPPTPAGVEAFALQPGDPLVLKDALYNSWQATLSTAEKESVTGLRVRWEWPERNEQQAPDTEEFRIYYEPGQLNARPGRTTAVSSSGASSTVTTDIAHGEPADAFAGCRLRIRNAFYDITASSAASPLVLTVNNLTGSAEDAVPAALAPCTVSVPPGHPLWTDYRKVSNWSTHSYTVTHVPGQHAYELILPQAGDADRSGVPLAPSTTTPVAYANIAVTAVDLKGNESAPSAPARIFAVNRTPPAQVVPVFTDDPMYATRADYLGRSFYTHKWPWSSGVYYHVLRAMDQTVFQIDWALRSAGNRDALTGSETGYFPSEADEPGWTAQRRSDVAAEINAVASKDDYAGLSDHALRVLAGLPGCERAFSQLTVQPLDPDDTANRDPADSSLMAHTDTLDGRSQNRYLYKVQAVDAAQNRGDLSLAGPPVHLYDVVPPRAPVLTRILGDERKVKLRWAANRESDLAEYRVYRTASEADARDVRLMDLVAAVPETEPDPKARAAVDYEDTTAIPARTHYYRVVAADTSGNASAPSATLSGRAIDTQPPDPPAFTLSEWQENGGVLGIRVEWESVPEGIQVLVQRRESEGTSWSGVSSWIAYGTTQYDDTGAEPHKSYDYRLRVKSAAGMLNVTYNETSVTALFAQG